MRRIPLAMAALCLLGALVIAGCGGGGSSSSSTASGSGSGETETASSSESGGYGYKSGGSAGGESEGSATASETTEGGGAGTGGGAAVVKVTNTPDLGKVIVGADGMTLYDFLKDKGTTSACYGACAAAWPPLLTEGTPKATGGAQSSLLGVTKRKDGTEQVTYNGHPLYGFVGDKKPGETNGNDFSEFSAEWYALEPSGEEPKDS